MKGLTVKELVALYDNGLYAPKVKEEVEVPAVQIEPTIMEVPAQPPKAEVIQLFPQTPDAELDETTLALRELFAQQDATLIVEEDGVDAEEFVEVAEKATFLKAFNGIVFQIPNADDYNNVIIPEGELRRAVDHADLKFDIVISTKHGNVALRGTTIDGYFTVRVLHVPEAIRKMVPIFWVSSNKSLSEKDLDIEAFEDILQNVVRYASLIKKVN